MNKIAQKKNKLSKNRMNAFMVLISMVFMCAYGVNAPEHGEPYLSNILFFFLLGSGMIMGVSIQVILKRGSMPAVAYAMCEMALVLIWHLLALIGFLEALYILFNVDWMAIGLMLWMVVLFVLYKIYRKEKNNILAEFRSIGMVEHECYLPKEYKSLQFLSASKVYRFLAITMKTMVYLGAGIFTLYYISLGGRLRHASLHPLHIESHHQFVLFISFPLVALLLASLKPLMLFLNTCQFLRQHEERNQVQLKVTADVLKGSKVFDLVN